MRCGSGILPRDFKDKTFSTPHDIVEDAMGVGEGTPQCGSLRMQQVWTDIFASRLPDGGGPAPLNAGISGRRKLVRARLCLDCHVAGTVPLTFGSPLMVTL